MTVLMKTLKLRIKDKHSKVLSAMACDVNTVWNFCNETSQRAVKDRNKWLSSYDLQKLTAGYSKCDGVDIGSATAQLVCEEYVARRIQFKKFKLKWRVSNQSKSNRSLGWIPFKKGCVKYKSGQLVFAKNRFSLWDSYGLSGYELRSGSFVQDSRGRWYVCICVDARKRDSMSGDSVGIDLGLSEVAVTSDGERIEGRFYRKLQEELGIAQRAKKKDRVRAIHAKISNQRKDLLHKFSAETVKRYGAIFVGDVSSKKLLKTRMAKSTMDAGWGILKTMLEYKSQQAGIVFQVVGENYSTQTCSCCGSIPESSPKGRAGLRIREWTCSDCGATHDRDINAARNILAAGHRRLEEGITALEGSEDVKRETEVIKKIYVSIDTAMEASNAKAD